MGESEVKISNWGLQYRHRRVDRALIPPSPCSSHTNIFSYSLLPYHRATDGPTDGQNLIQSCVFAAKKTTGRSSVIMVGGSRCPIPIDFVWCCGVEVMWDRAQRDWKPIFSTEQFLVGLNKGFKSGSYSQGSQGLNWGLGRLMYKY